MNFAPALPLFSLPQTARVCSLTMYRSISPMILNAVWNLPSLTLWRMSKSHRSTLRGSQRYSWSSINIANTMRTRSMLFSTLYDSIATKPSSEEHSASVFVDNKLRRSPSTPSMISLSLFAVLNAASHSILVVSSSSSRLMFPTIIRLSSLSSFIKMLATPSALARPFCLGF